MKSEIIAYKTLSFKIQSRKGLNRLYRIGKEKKIVFFSRGFRVSAFLETCIQK